MATPTRRRRALACLGGLALCAGSLVGAPGALALHGCEENEGNCENAPQVIVCVQPSSCEFDGKKEASLVGDPTKLPETLVTIIEQTAAFVLSVMRLAV